MDEDTESAYEILGVPKTATTAQIRKIYIKLAREWHPDRGCGTEDDIKKRTIKMYKLNAAKDLLLDPGRRAKHDEDLQDRAENGGHASRYRGTGYTGDFNFSEKPRPSGLGVPYSGSRKNAETFSCTTDGERGTDGHPGRRGFEGSGYGGDGQAGGNAGPATCGKHAGDMKIHLRMTVTPGGYFELDIHHIRAMNEIIDPRQNNMRSVPLKAFGTLAWNAEGGEGGAGGVGGDGGNGARGYPGRDATRYSSGTNGGPGGRGGNGGLGTHGADGGRGGDVEICLDWEDAYLLLRVDGCHPIHGTESRVRGGVGGIAGHHGRGGSGGLGGRGGSSYRWTETRYTQTYDSSSRSYRSVPTTVYKSNPGGWSGPPGRSGLTPTSPLHSGSNGKNGTFTIKLKKADGKEYCYTSRFNLEFVAVVTEQLSEMIQQKTFEFGESVYVRRIEVENTGGMEMPNQRVLLRYGTVTGVVHDTSGHIFLEEGKQVAPGKKDFADEGTLQFYCPYPRTVRDEESQTTKPTRNVTDFDPISCLATFLYRAYQLGHENQTDDIAKISDFQARYTDFQDEADVMHLSHPVENPDGLRGFRSLAPLETSILEFTVRNISHQEFGSSSKTGRALFAQVYFADDRTYEIPIKKVVVRAEDGKIVNVRPSMSARGKGYRYNIPSLPTSRDFTVQLSYKLNHAQIQVSEKCGLQVDLYLQEIPELLPSGERADREKKHLVQRRLFVASCQPRFKPYQASDAILVTTTGSTAKQVSAWNESFSKLGCSVNPYSLSRYGHINADESVEGVALQEAFAGKLVVILNDDYVPIPNVKSSQRTKYRPSQLLTSAYDHPRTAKFLVVGGTPQPVSHLSLTAVALNTKRVSKTFHTNMKTCRESVQKCLQDQRGHGFALHIERPESFEVCVKMKCVRQPDSGTIDLAMKKRAAKAARWFKKTDPLRPYEVSWKPHANGIQVKETWPKTWEIAKLRVLVGTPRSQNALTHVEEHRGCPRLSNPDTIKSSSMMYALLQALSFDTMMSCFCRAIASSRSQDDVIKVIRDCIVGDFVIDVTNYHHGRMTVPVPLNRSQTIQLLRYCEDLNGLIEKSEANVSLRARLKKHLSLLAGAMQCAARSKDLRPWWKPFSSKFRVSRHMVEALHELEEYWYSTGVLHKEIAKDEKHRLKDVVKSHIKARKQSRFAMVGIRGRWRATLLDVHSPRDPSGSYRNQNLRPLVVRREFDVAASICKEGSSSLSSKVKKCSSQTLNPSESSRALNTKLLCDAYRGKIYKTTAAEYELYVRTTHEDD